MTANAIKASKVYLAILAVFVNQEETWLFPQSFNSPVHTQVFFEKIVAIKSRPSFFTSRKTWLGPSPPAWELIGNC